MGQVMGAGATPIYTARPYTEHMDMPLWPQGPPSVSLRPCARAPARRPGGALLLALLAPEIYPDRARNVRLRTGGQHENSCGDRAYRRARRVQHVPGTQQPADALRADERQPSANS